MNNKYSILFSGVVEPRITFRGEKEGRHYVLAAELGSPEEWGGNLREFGEELHEFFRMGGMDVRPGEA